MLMQWVMGPASLWDDVRAASCMLLRPSIHDAALPRCGARRAARPVGCCSPADPRAPQGAPALGGRPIARRTVICCPTSLVGNWESECAKWLKGRVRWGRGAGFAEACMFRIGCARGGGAVRIRLPCAVTFYTCARSTAHARAAGRLRCARRRGTRCLTACAASCPRLTPTTASSSGGAGPLQCACALVVQRPP